MHTCKKVRNRKGERERDKKETEREGKLLCKKKQSTWIHIFIPISLLDSFRNTFLNIPKFSSFFSLSLSIFLSFSSSVSRMYSFSIKKFLSQGRRVTLLTTFLPFTSLEFTFNPIIHSLINLLVRNVHFLHSDSIFPFSFHSHLFWKNLDEIGSKCNPFSLPSFSPLSLLVSIIFSCIFLSSIFHFFAFFSIFFVEFHSIILRTGRIRNHTRSASIPFRFLMETFPLRGMDDFYRCRFFESFKSYNFHFIHIHNMYVSTFLYNTFLCISMHA